MSRKCSSSAVPLKTASKGVAKNNSLGEINFETTLIYTCGCMRLDMCLNVYLSACLRLCVYVSLYVIHATIHVYGRNLYVFLSVYMCMSLQRWMNARCN